MEQTPTSPNTVDSDSALNSITIAAYLLGHSIAVERAVMTLISMKDQDLVAQHRSLQADLEFRNGMIAADLEFRDGMIAADLARCGLDASLQPLVQNGFQAGVQALLRIYAKNGFEPVSDGFPAFPASLLFPRSPIV
ncbi:hypothetical protein [Luteimonas panaciterrae]|uniref:hypothetical protein n=1 Tax=Luteimonas panaciterrae TaxID=363885 RepID=UPI001CFC31DD|nr:hypothetical protein [Luteimonas panaciterrae]